mmetsp:Transcript_13379/g.48709  ORF Transcript_13379/g.48709 Transcript_13379/m.48709 type:complete len:485 (-) Transcript_13379:181-1635(-)
MSGPQSVEDGSSAAASGQEGSVARAWRWRRAPRAVLGVVPNLLRGTADAIGRVVPLVPRPLLEALLVGALAKAGHGAYKQRQERQRQRLEDAKRKREKRRAEARAEAMEDLRGLFADIPGLQFVERSQLAPLNISQRALGQGSYGKIYASSWLGQPVVLKRLRRLSSAEDVQVLVQEAAVLARLRPHPCVALYYGVSVDVVEVPSRSDDESFCFSPDIALIMDLQEGDLGMLLYSRHRTTGKHVHVVSWPDVLGLCTQIAQGMAYLHSHSLVHLDLKPENVLLEAAKSGTPTVAGGRWRARITDFGLARLTGKNEEGAAGLETEWAQLDDTAKKAHEGPGEPAAVSGDLRSTSHRLASGGPTSSRGSLYIPPAARHTQKPPIGTYSYMPPEAFEDEVLGSSCDVYSFGVLSWTMLSRKRPWQHIRSVSHLVDAVCNGERPRMPSPWPANCPKAFDDVVQRCWAQDAASRPTFDAVVTELQKLGT